MARGPRQIIGLTIQAAARKDEGHRPLPFTGIGILTLWDSQLGDGNSNDDDGEDENNNDNCILPNGIARLRGDEMAIDDILWSEPGTCHFAEPYYNNTSLRFVNYDESRTRAELVELNDDLVPHDVLLWAADTSELAQLKRISIFIAYSDEVDNVKFGVFDICGLGVEFVDGHPDGSRFVGLRGRESGSIEQAEGAARKQPQLARGSDAALTEMQGGRGNWRIDMDIDGPGGEFITGVSSHEGSNDWPVSGLKVSSAVLLFSFLGLAPKASLDSFHLLTCGMNSSGQIEAARPGAGWTVAMTMVTFRNGLRSRIRLAALWLGWLCDLTAGAGGTPMVTG